MNNLDWIKENVTIFLDQNINLDLKDILIKNGYKKVLTVFDIHYKGANDGKLLKILKQNKFLLVTHDYHFYKMAMKYNHGFVIKLFLRNGSGDIYGTKRKFSIIQDELNKNYKIIREVIELQ